MTESTPVIRWTMLPFLLLCACGEAEKPKIEVPPDPVAPAVAVDSEQPRELTSEEQKQVLDAVFQAKAKEQAEGLGSGSVKVNGAWPYTGYSELAPDPAAAIEARLVAVDVTISGHTTAFDIDDIEIVDGASLVSYGSDPHATPLGGDCSLLPADQPVVLAPDASRWLLIYAFPRHTPSFRLYYWGKELTVKPVEFENAGLSLPYPAKE